MIDKLNNINAGNAQNKRVSDNSKEKVSSSKNVSETSNNTSKAGNVKISPELNIKDMKSEAPIDTVKEIVSPPGPTFSKFKPPCPPEPSLYKKGSGLVKLFISV